MDNHNNKNNKKKNTPEKLNKSPKDNIERRDTIFKLTENYFFGLWMIKLNDKKPAKHLHRKFVEFFNAMEIEVPILIQKLEEANFSNEEILSITIQKIKKYYVELDNCALLKI